ncbi:MAG TPA: hypothetical protein VJU79_10380, partial [Candidatus Dormibacteraeota bacterium]|nr:hypothetical protein [Candidatus Dormibacteraeota bacterium]
AGWNHTTVTVSFRCSDPTPGSGAVTAAVSGGGTFTNETTRAGTTVTSTGACDDVAGNAGVPSSITLKIDKTPPSTRIVSAPPARTNSTTAQFTFAGTDSLSGIAGFACTLDGAPTACAGSSAVFSGLAGGTHKLLVKAMDVAGNVDATGKTATWFVDLTAPVITFTSPHQGDTTEPTGAVHFTVTDPDDATPSTTCALDGQVAAACSSSFTYTGLIAGAHTLVVTARDRAGNSATNTLNFSTAVLSSVSPVHVPSTGAAPRPAGGLVAISAGIAMVMLGVARRRRSRRSG